jgi:hypothetical protein
MTSTCTRKATRVKEKKPGVVRYSGVKAELIPSWLCALLIPARATGLSPTQTFNALSHWDRMLFASVQADGSVKVEFIAPCMIHPDELEKAKA